MWRFLKWILNIIIVLVIFTGGLLFATRYSDGPLEIIAGGPFTSGELSPAPDDWSFLTDRDTIEFQTLDPARSRTVWLAVHDSRLFVVSGYMTTGYGAIWKQWPHYLQQDDRIILRIDGRLHEQRLQRITSGSDIEPVLSEFSRKYGDDLGMGATEVTEGHTWMYQVVDR
jgi:hypothetical protein